MIKLSVHTTAMSLVLAAFILFAHWGFNELYSFQFIFFCLVFVSLLTYIVNQSIILIYGLLTVVLFFLLSLASGQDTHMILKGLRTAIVITLLFAVKRIALYGEIRLIATWSALLYKALLIACTFSMCIGIFQLVDSLFYNSGYIDIPKGFFALDYGTLFSDRRSQLSADGYFIRPSAFFSEPSTLGLLGNIGTFLGLIYRNKLLLIVSIVAVVISFSLSGFLICFLSFAYYFIFVKTNLTTRKSQLMPALFFLTFFIFGFVLLQGRMSIIASKSDVSTIVRFTEPLRIIIEMFARGEYFGLTPDLLSRRMSNTVSTIFDNWILNQFLYYGILGFVPIALLFVLFGPVLGSSFLFIGVVNGDLFYYDRFIFLLVLVVLYSSTRNIFSVNNNAFNSHRHI